MKREYIRLREGMKGTNAEEEIQKLRWKTKGADSAKEEKCMMGKLNCEG